ncbi:MAG: hypothetical protein ACREE4_22120 [Stellaceae bacterium]
MAREHIENLRRLRDELVEERRQMVVEAFTDPEVRRETAGDFIGLQHLIDVVERAMAHEASLDRAPPRAPADRPAPSGGEPD